LGKTALAAFSQTNLEASMAVKAMIKRVRFGTHFREIHMLQVGFLRELVG
jgi:hypothetical protein